VWCVVCEGTYLSSFLAPEVCIEVHDEALKERREEGRILQAMHTAFNTSIHTHQPAQHPAPLHHHKHMTVSAATELADLVWVAPLHQHPQHP